MASPFDNNNNNSTSSELQDEQDLKQQLQTSSPFQGPSSALDKDSHDSSVQVKVAQNIIKERTLLHRVRGIFAKVSRDNFKEVKDELCALPIRQSKDEEVREIVHWIYDKAVQPEDEIFVELYANLIKELTSDIQGKDAKKSSALRKALVEKCQQSFDKRTDVNKASADKISGEANAETTVQTRDSAASAALKESIAKDEDADYVKNRERSRLRSNIKFLAQLVRVQMVTVKVVNYVLYTLLYGSQGAKRHKAEEYEIEMFCDLIKNTQKLLPTDVRSSYLPNYMATVKDYSENSKTSPRVKFLLMDLLELYKHNWEDRETRRKKGQLGTGAGAPIPLPSPVTPNVPGTASQGGVYRPPGAHHQPSTSNISDYEGTPTPPYSPVVSSHRSCLSSAYPGAGGRGGAWWWRGGDGGALPGGNPGLAVPASQQQQQQPPAPPVNASKETFIVLMDKFKAKEVGAKEISDHFALLSGPFTHLRQEHLTNWILESIKMVHKSEDRKLVCEILSILIESKICRATIGCELMNQLAPQIPVEMEDVPMIFSTWAELLQMKYATIIPPASHSALLRELVKDENVMFSDIDKMLHDVSPSASWTFSNPADAALSRCRMLPIILNCTRESDDGMDAAGGSSMLSEKNGSSMNIAANSSANNNDDGAVIPPRRQDLLGYLLTHPEHARADTTSAVDIELDIFEILTNVENTTSQANLQAVLKKAKSHSQRSDPTFCAGFFCAIFCYLRLAPAKGERTDFEKIREILTQLKVPGENSQLFLRELYMTYCELGCVPHGTFQAMAEIFSPGKDARDASLEWKTFNEWRSKHQHSIQYIVGRPNITRAAARGSGGGGHHGNHHGNQVKRAHGIEPELPEKVSRLEGQLKQLQAEAICPLKQVSSQMDALCRFVTKRFQKDISQQHHHHSFHGFSSNVSAPNFQPNSCLKNNLKNTLLQLLAANPDVNFKQIIKTDPTTGKKVLSPQFELAFHCTDPTAALGIMCKGFDPTRRSRQMYGRGEYFGEWSDRGFKTAKEYDNGAMIVALIVKLGPVTRPNNGLAMIVVNNPVDKSATFCIPICVAFTQGNAPVPTCNCSQQNSAAASSSSSYSQQQKLQVQYVDDHSSWQNMDSHSSSYLVSKLQSKCLQFDFKIGSHNYTFDLSNNTQTNKSTGKQRQIRFV